MRLIQSCSGKWLLVGTLFSAGLMSVWSIATAEDFKKRLYLNGGVGVTHIEPESSTDAFQMTDTDDMGAHIAIGFDVNRFLTVEAYAAGLGDSEVEFLGTPVDEVGYQVFGVSALGYLLNSRSGMALGDDDTTGLFRREGASLYGRVGLGFMSNEADIVDYNRDYSQHVAFGLGVEYGFRNGFALRSELMSLDTDAKYLNVGLLKRFGSSTSSAAAPVLAKALPVKAEQEQPADVPAPKEVQPQQMMFRPVVSPFIYFEFDNAELSVESKSKLDSFAQAVGKNELRLEVEGHSDWISAESYNMDLSVRRAEAVANYLVGRGVAQDRITTIGYGESRPVSTNATEEGRALNRRTEIQLR